MLQAVPTLALLLEQVALPLGRLAAIVKGGTETTLILDVNWFQVGWTWPETLVHGE